MTSWVYVDETKRAGYVLAGVTVADPEAARKVVRGLILPGQRRLHMVDERPSRKRAIVSGLVAIPVEITIYDAARRYRTDREARAACFGALVEDLAHTHDRVRLVIEQDDTLLRSDRHELYHLARAAGRSQAIDYRHIATSVPTRNHC